jgi:hypothetical protein
MWWFWVPYMVEAAIALGGSLYFLTTWWGGVSKKWSVQAVDAGGWMVLVALSYGLLWVNVLAYDVPVPTTKSRGVQALLTSAAVDVAVVVRLIQWRRIQKESHEQEALIVHQEEESP